MKHSRLPFYKWRPSLSGLACLYLGVHSFWEGEDFQMSFFFTLLAIYLLVMYSYFWESEFKRHLHLEDLRVRKVIRNQPKNRSTRFTQEVILLSFFTILFLVFMSVAPEGVLNYLLIFHIIYCALKTANFNKPHQLY